MKKFILMLVMTLIGVFAADAQVLQFKSDAYCQKQINSYGYWSNWSKWEKCSVSITINLDNDVVTIYSNRTQYYKIYDFSGSYYDGTTRCVDYRFYDQDGDRGTMTLAVKANGQSEIYIRFANIQWAYVVHRL